MFLMSLAMLRLSILWILTPDSAFGMVRMIEPMQRSSLWRRGEPGAPRNIKDGDLNCGGFEKQWITNTGCCGICGDPCDGVRENEDGGKYARNIIASTYIQGNMMPVTIVRTNKQALGYFEFRICEASATGDVTQECLDNNVLLIQESDFGNRYYPGSGGQTFQLNVKLPPHLFCTRCVVQFKYNTGYRSPDPSSNCDCLGCGKQEQYFNCADISIKWDGKYVAPISSTAVLTSTLHTNISTSPSQSVIGSPSTSASCACSSLTTVTINSCITQQIQVANSELLVRSSVIPPIVPTPTITAFVHSSSRTRELPSITASVSFTSQTVDGMSSLTSRTITAPSKHLGILDNIINLVNRLKSDYLGTVVKPPSTSTQISGTSLCPSILISTQIVTLTETITASRIEDIQPTPVEVFPATGSSFFGEPSSVVHSQTSIGTTESLVTSSSVISTTPGSVCSFKDKIYMCYSIYSAVSNDWCNYNCPRNFCPPYFCQCMCSPHIAGQSTTIKSAIQVCKSLRGGVPDLYCEQNCKRGHCPAGYCTCAPVL